MSERKVLNKYRKIDIQFEKINYQQKKKNFSSIRFMIPFDVFCLFCRNIIFKGTKINAIKEKIEKEDYIKIKIFRFYFKCINCNKGMTLKTDPKNSFYISEVNCKKY